MEADLDLLLKHVDLVLLLYQLLLLFGNLRRKRHVPTCWYLCHLALRRENINICSVRVGEGLSCEGYLLLLLPGQLHLLLLLLQQQRSHVALL